MAAKNNAGTSVIDQDLTGIRSSVIDIALEAGDAILKIYKQDSIVARTKEDSSPVTDADMSSHEIICRRLQALYPYPVFSEEDPVEYEVRKDWQAFWLVDPLDGTKNFLAKDDQFTVNIGLISGTKPVVGVVHVPALAVTYSAALGGGAWKRDSDGERKIMNRSSRTGDQLIAATSCFHDTPRTEEFCSHYGIEKLRKVGSSLKLCRLSEGELDVYPRLNGTKEWDTAASQCIVYEAGAKMIDVVTKKELVYNKEDYRNNFFIASRNDLHFDWPL